jgi:hypothetical protein
MPIDLDVLCRQIEPARTILLFGAGSSIPSGGMSAPQLGDALAKRFKVPDAAGFALSEVAALIEKRHSRRDLIDFLHSKICSLRATGAILNLPLYDWSGIYTTNYDTIIEQSYKRAHVDCLVYSLNFDFTVHTSNTATKIFKLHGTIEKDPCYGDNSRIIITEGDLDISSQYRENLYDNFRLQISSGGALVIIGHSLADSDLKAEITEALRRKRDSGCHCKIFLLLFVEEPARAALFEDRGVEICFGSLDSFFSALVKIRPNRGLALTVTSDPLDRRPSLRPSTVDAAHAMANGLPGDVFRMFNGRAATYSDIRTGFTFERDFTGRIEASLASQDHFIATIIGAAGVGKTTLGRQVLSRLFDRGYFCWEHKNEFELIPDDWLAVAETLRVSGQSGVLFIDDAHDHLREIGTLVDGLARHPRCHLKIILASTRHRWNPRLKSPTIFAKGIIYELSQLSGAEIESLLDLLERNVSVTSLVEERFCGFSRPERRRRLIDRCSADMFVCLKNIFSFDRIDDIILREYADLANELQNIYRTVAAMEASGVKVHRQLVIRTLGIAPSSVARILESLTDIVSEYTLSEKDGIYIWHGRHSVVVDILTAYKFNDQGEYFTLIDCIISKLNLTLNVEIRTLRDLCDMHVGIGRITDKKRQNVLFRRMISAAPNERVPRHRLIRNLIDQEEYDQAETEIRIFDKELKSDAPVTRYKVLVHLRRAETTKGIMQEDRGAIVMRAASIAQEALKRYREDKNLYAVYCEAGLAYYKHTGRWNVFDEAMAELKDAENRILDPEVGRLISKYEGVSQRYQSGQVAA